MKPAMISRHINVEVGILPLLLGSYVQVQTAKGLIQISISSDGDLRVVVPDHANLYQWDVMAVGEISEAKCPVCKAKYNAGQAESGPIRP